MADHDVQCPTCGGTGYVPTGRDRWPYHCLGVLPAAPTPTSVRVRAYMADRRFLRAHASDSVAHWKRVRLAERHLAGLEDQQRARSAKTRAAEIDRWRTTLSDMRVSAAADVACECSRASERCQEFRQTYYGAWYGLRTRRAWVGNYHLSYGHIVPWNERASIGA